MLQLPLVPAYALTVHKSQVLARAVRDVRVRVDLLLSLMRMRAPECILILS